MQINDTMEFVDSCFHDEPASCQCACPFNFDIKTFLTKAKKGRWSAAYRDISTAMLFPVAATSYCEKKCLAPCRLALGNSQPVNIPEIEKACLSFTLNERPQTFTIPQKPQSIAVVGAGIAGLSCALTLARKKYRVSIFEAENSIGGSLKSAQNYEEIKTDIERQFSCEAVNFIFNSKPSEDELFSFDAVYIATGKDGEDFGLLSSWDSKSFAAARKGWFLGGALCGMTVPQSINAGRQLSKNIEAYIQTGNPVPPDGSASGSVSCSSHMINHSKEDVKEPVIPQENSLYTKEEAKQEADRCMQCICDYCLQGCEVLRKYKKTPFKLAADICGDSNTVPPFSNCEATREVYSCNLCTQCENICPEGINIGKLFRFSREDRWKQGKWIPGMHDYWLRELDFNTGDAYYASSGKFDYVFFPGCQLSSILTEQTMFSYEYLKEKLNAGIILSCCGAPAVWAGDLDRKERTREKLQAELERMGNPAVITACSSCTQFLKQLIPSVKVVSIYEIMDKKGFEIFQSRFKEAAVFPPCSAVHNEEIKNAVSDILSKCSCSAESLPDDGKCCGFGGHIKLANRPMYDEITSNRASRSEKPYIVYCANCLDVFKGKGKECAHILELVFNKYSDKMPVLEEKRNNALSLKEKIMKAENKEFVRSRNEWDSLKLTFSDEARANMEDKLIRDGEVAEVVYKAESDNSFFENSEGMRIATLEKDVLTYWVEYTKNNNGYYVNYAYYHRMHIMG